MKTNYTKCSIWLVALLCITIACKAQTVSQDRESINGKTTSSYDVSRSENGKQVERIQMDVNDKAFKIEFVDNKMTELYVNGDKIATADWDKYSDDIATIRLQIKRNKEQAIRNQEQARLNEIQAKKNQAQAVLNQEQAQRNNIQEKKNEEQAQRNERQAEQNRIQEKKNAAQAVLNEEQGRKNELQAKKNEEQARENERLIKQLTEDLVNDKIVPDKNSLRSFTINADEMTVNGIKQPDSVFKKYKEKYSQFSKGNFNFSRDGIYQGN